MRKIGKKTISFLLGMVTCLTMFGGLLNDSFIFKKSFFVYALTSADFSISQNGVNFICEREGFSPKCYYDGNQSSIGYGTKCGTSAHSSGLHSITKEAAKTAMMNEINSSYVPNVRRQTAGIQMNQNQFDALVSFTYNTGGGTKMIANSPLVKYLKGQLSAADARSQFANYIVTNSATGKVDQGLINRRKAEADLFFSGSSTPTPSSQSPKGVVDSASGGAGTVSVAGWGFDPDNTSAAIDVHVYLRDGSGNMIGIANIKADQSREDVNNVHGCGNNHGYSATISTDYKGNYHVMVALIDSGSGDPTWCDGGDITITSADKTKPVVSNATFSKITPTGFTVKCNATDDKKIKNVRVAIWIHNVTEPIWHDCVSNGNDTYSFDFDISSYNNQKGPYNCHIYAYDESGNEGFAAPEPISINCNLGDNFDAMIKNPNSGKYVITSVNNDNVMLYQFINSFGSKQVWNFSRNSDGSYRITSHFNSKCLDVNGDETGKNIYTWTANDNATQKWFLANIGGNYKFFPACSNTRCMDISGGITDNRTNIQLWDTNDSNAQKFTIDKISDNTAPVIKDVKISDITKDGYKVTVTVTDNIGVKIVKVPTWTKNNSQDDLIWHEAKQTSDNTWTYTVKVSDHNNERGVYYTDVYADDFAGNSDSWQGENQKRKTIKVGMYDLTLNPNGGTVVTESGTKTASAYKPAKNQLIYLGGNFNSMSWAKPSRTGYTLTGWFTAAKGGTKVHGADGKCVNEGTYFKNGNYQKAAALTLYAQWKANSYTVTLNANGGSCDKKNISVTYDSKYGTLPTPTRKGYTFTSWYTAATGGTKVTTDTKVAVTANQTLYAQWKAATVKGDVNNDGEFSVADAVLLQEWLLDVPDIKLENWKAADLCEDGILDVFDLCLMKRMLVNS